MATTSAIYNVNEDFFRSGAGTTKPNGTTDTTEAVARPGNLGLGIADPSTLAGKLDISGAQILRPVALPNFATNGSVGTAATTVDVASHLTLTQTTAGIALTLPAPTNAQAGRLLIVESLPASTVPVTIAGQAVLPGAGTFFVWSGTAWVALGSAAADFWRTTTNALPDGTNDTTDNIRRLGNVGIGGAALTDTMPTVNTPSVNNNYFQLSGSTTNRGQLMYGNSPLLYFMSRTIPTVISDYVSIGSWSVSAQASAFLITVNVSSSNFAVSKIYLAAMNFDSTGGAWRVLRPISDGGPHLGNNFELLVNVSGSVLSLRIRRISGATPATARVYLQCFGDPATVLTESTAAGTDAAVYSAYEPQQIPWLTTGNSTTVPSAYNHAGAQAGNFVGTLDNVALSLYTNASAANSKSDLQLYTSVPTGNVIAAPADIFHIRRGGQAGVVWPQIMSIALGKWFADVNARTRADIRLANGPTITPDFTALSLFSQGGIGINGNGAAGDWAWTAGGGIGRGNGGALLALMGGNGSNNVGPHIGAWTQADTFPLFYQLNWTHNNIAMCFDGYFDGAFRNAHTSRPYAIYKVNDALNICGAAAAGAAGAAWAQDLIARFRYAGATLAGGELDFNNVVKNRRIVLFDTNAASDHQYYGFGINTNTFRYQVDSVNAAHRFYAGTAAGTSQEIIAFLGNRQIDVNSAIILRSVAIANVLANGAVGTAAATVDISSTLVLAQTTANIALTLPSPANTTAGRVLYVTHNGTAACTVAGKALNPGETLSFIWDGNTWNPPAYVAPSNRAYVLCDAPAKKAVANATATLANWTEITDAGNNHAAGIFTAPRTGLYQVSAMVTYLAAAWNANTYAQIAIAINGVDARQATSSNESAGNRIISVNISATIRLTAGQNIRINVYQNSGAAKNTTGGINSFYTIVEL